ncbi:MAG TPA: ABC transporter ATP-binding protein [Xanthobacteraceae bacterium]|jgi:NitT/TauT family transport system ATP-binding protein
MYISVEGVAKRYDTRSGSVDALKPVSFEVEENEFVSIVGPSGCGKSTLLMIVSGLLPASAGSVRIKSSKVLGPYTGLGFVFQQDVLLEWRTVLQNVMLQAQVRRLDRQRSLMRAKQLLRLVGLEEFEDKYPYELSGGMRQRAAICRALLHEPDLLLMDEPFGALDAIARDQLNEDLLRYRREAHKTIMFVTHSIPEAVFLSDRVLVMSPRPGCIEEIIAIDLPHPRHLTVRETPKFAELVGRIIRIFESVGVFKKAQ